MGMVFTVHTTDRLSVTVDIFFILVYIIFSSVVCENNKGSSFKSCRGLSVYLKFPDVNIGCSKTGDVRWFPVSILVLFST